MTRHALLNNVDHKDLRIITERSAKFGDNVRGALTFFWEFRSVQAHYPIVFNKNPETSEFTALAMFGFEEGENLFLGDDGWTIFFFDQLANFSLIVTQVVKADSVQDQAQRVMLVFDNLRGKGLGAVITAVELDGLVLVLAPAALDHFPTLAVGAFVSRRIWGLAGVLPE